MRGGLSEPEVGDALLDGIRVREVSDTVRPGLYDERPFVFDGKVSKVNTSRLDIVTVDWIEGTNSIYVLYL